MFTEDTIVSCHLGMKSTVLCVKQGTNTREEKERLRRETWGCVNHYDIRQPLEHDNNNNTHTETSIRKNGLISETEASNCITQEHTFTKIILTASATQLVHRGQRNQKNLNS